MNMVLWTVQFILAGLFLLSGTMKTFWPIDRIAKRLPWAASMPPALVRFIGGSQLLGAIGLLAPQLTGILPWLTPLAAAGLATIMVLAALFHARRGEYSAIRFNGVLLVLALFIAYGRLALAPII